MVVDTTDLFTNISVNFQKYLNGPIGILRGPGDQLKNLRLKILRQTTFKKQDKLEKISQITQ